MIRMITGLSVLAMIGCGPEPLEEKAALANLKSQAEEVGKSALEEDHERMAELTHPELVEKLGGKDRYVTRLTEITDEMKSAGLRLESYETKEPAGIVVSEGDHYAIVPSILTMSAPGGGSVRQNTYLIGFSDDGGRSWSFLDGAGVGGDRSKLKQIMPDFPDALTLPDVGPVDER